MTGVAGGAVARLTEPGIVAPEDFPLMRHLHAGIAEDEPPRHTVETLLRRRAEQERQRVEMWTPPELPWSGENGGASLYHGVIRPGDAGDRGSRLQGRGLQRRPGVTFWGRARCPSTFW